MVLQLLPPLYLYLCFRDYSYLYLLYMCLCFRDDGPQEGFGGVVLATRAATSALWPGGRRPLHPGSHPCHLDPAHCCSNQGEDTSFMFCLANGVSTVRIEDWNIWTFYWHRLLGVEVTGQVGVAGEGDGEGGEQGGGPAASCKEGEQLFSFQRILLINHKNKDKEQGEGRAADSSTNWRENGSKTSKNIPRLNQKVTGAVQPASARPREEDEHNDFPTSHQEDFPRGALHYNIESIKSHWVNWAQQANQQVDND